VGLVWQIATFNGSLISPQSTETAIGAETPMFTVATAKTCVCVPFNWSVPSRLGVAASATTSGGWAASDDNSSVLIPSMPGPALAPAHWNTKRSTVGEIIVCGVNAKTKDCDASFARANGVLGVPVTALVVG